MQGRDACGCSEDHKTFYDFGRLKSNTVHYRVHQFPSNLGDTPKLHAAIG